MCDLCLSPPEATDVTEAAQKALSAVHRLSGRFGRGRIVDHLLGNTKKALASETQLSTYGIGRELSGAMWRDLLDQLLLEGLLREHLNDGRPLLGLGAADEVRAVYRRSCTVIALFALARSAPRQTKMDAARVVRSATL